MTIFEEYLSRKKEENKLEMDYLWSFHDYKNNMYNVEKAKTTLHECGKSLNKLDKIKEKRISVGNKICELSYLTNNEAKTILPKVMKDTIFEDYEFKSLIIDGLRRVFLIKKTALLNFDLTMDNLLTNENIIFLASTTYKNGFRLYQNISGKDEIGSELTPLVNNDAKFLKEFIDSYITKKAKTNITLEDYYISTRNNIEYGYDEALAEYYGLDDAYQAYDREEQRRGKRRLDAYYHQKQKNAKNQVKAKRKLEQLPNKYMPKENVGTLTFIRKLELMLGRKFSSIEKDTIKSWIIFGFDEDVIMEAYNEASIRGNYNPSAVAEILRDLITFEQKENNVKNIMLTKEMQKQ